MLRYGKGVLNLDAKVSDGAFDLGVAEQKLHGTQFARSAVDQRGLCPAQGVGAEQMWVQPDAGHPNSCGKVVGLSGSL
jgi:hypothetical protein